MIQGGMVSISSVKITPDLFEARIYLSFYQIPETAGGTETDRGQGLGNQTRPGKLHSQSAEKYAPAYLLYR